MEKNLSQIVTESELLDLLGIKKESLDRLRQDEGLPFCKITRTNRVYLVEDVLDFIRGRRLVLNRS